MRPAALIPLLLAPILGTSAHGQCLIWELRPYDNGARHVGWAADAWWWSLAMSETSIAVQPGETWNSQAWYRDNNPGPTSNFTDAVSVTFN